MDQRNLNNWARVLKERCFYKQERGGETGLTGGKPPQNLKGCLKKMEKQCVQFFNYIFKKYLLKYWEVTAGIVGLPSNFIHGVKKKSRKKRESSSG